MVGSSAVALLAGGAFIERLTGRLMGGVASGETLPAVYDDIDISRVELEAVADAAAHFGGDQARARAEKRIIDRLTGPAVVGDRPAHAFDGLLGAMPRALLALSIAERIIVEDFPHCRLRAVTLPVARFSVAHRVTAAFVLPVIIATAQREVLLNPDDLRATLQPAGRQVGTHDIAVQRSVPDISDIASKQRIGLPPVGAVIVQHLAPRQLAGTEATARPPGGIIVDPVRRIGDHQVGLRSGQHRLDIRRVGAVATADPVVVQQPYVAGPSDRLIGYLQDGVGIGQTARSQAGQDLVEPVRLEAD